MNRVAIVAAACAVACVATPASAVVYATRAAFNAAVPKTATVDFDFVTGGDTLGGGATYSNSNVTFSDSRVFVVGPTFNNYAAGSSYGSGYLEWQGDTAGPTSLTISFLQSGVNAVAFDFMELRANAAPFLITVNGEVFNYTTENVPQFFGYSSGAPLSSLSVTMVGTTNLFATLDNFTFGGPNFAGVVPEPATWALMVLGFGGLGYAMRRRSASGVRIRFT